MAESTGYIKFQYKSETYQTWYCVVGDIKGGGNQPPLVVLHGGPSLPSYYLNPLKTLHSTLRAPIIFYDQIGGGKSTHVKNKPAKFWTVDLFKMELENVLAHFDIADRFDLLGHSWGGVLAVDYVLSRNPRGLRRFVICNSPASMALWMEGTNRLLERFPAKVVEGMRRHEREGTTDDPEYQKWTRVFYGKHVCTLDPWPKDVAAAFSALAADPVVQQALVGPSEFNLTGSLRAWSVVGKLDRVAVPTLVINGAEDEAQDVCVKPFVDEIPNVKWVKFAKSSHMPFYEENKAFLRAVTDFLK